MSADKWTRCFNCRKMDTEREIDIRDNLLDEAFSSGYRKDYDGLMKELSELAERDISPALTMRHDFEICDKIDSDGIIIIRYASSCHVCGIRLLISDRLVEWDK